jgi:FKBP-type peptidyl-prolyl cis-trans isomerase
MLKRIILLSPVAASLVTLALNAQPQPTTKPSSPTTQPGAAAAIERAAASTATTKPAGNTVTTAEGLTIITTAPGDPGAKAGDIVWVHYTGTLKDGTKFDSSLDRGEPIRFTLGRHEVIEGWDKGIAGMKIGEKRTLIIPSALGYKEAGSPPKIPANAELHFDVELIGDARVSQQ